MLYNPPTGGAANDPYVGKNTAGGTQGSKVPPAAIEFTQREIVAIIAASGQAPTNTILVQAAMALARGVFVGALTGSGDLAVATLGVVFPSLLQGMRIRGVASAANTTTSPKLRVANVGSAGGTIDLPILKADGSTPAVGEIKAGRRYEYEVDGASPPNAIITGGGLATGGLISGACILASGAFSIPVPAGARRIWLNELTGAGAAGGTVSVSGTGGAASGGTGGGRARGSFFDIAAGVTAITGTVGAGGAASNTPTTNGGNGGSTFINQSCLVQTAPVAQGGVGGVGTGFASGVVATNSNVASASGGYRNQTSAAASGGFLAGGYYSGGAGSGPGGSSYSTPSSGTNNLGAAGAEPGGGGQGGGVTGSGTALGGAGKDGLVDISFYG